MPGGFSSGFSTGFNVYTFNITTTSVPHIHYSLVYSSQFLADEASPVWTLQSGVLPSGITLAADGELAGITFVGSGLYPVVVRATSSLTSTIDDEPFIIQVLGSVISGWNRVRSVRNFKLFGEIYG